MSIEIKEIERDIVNRIDPGERTVLTGAGALIYLLTGKTVGDYIQDGRPVWCSVERLVILPSRLTEVAIFPDPTEFLVPGTNDKSFAEQQTLVEEDSDALLRRKLGLEGVEQIIGGPADLTGITFQHFDEGLLRGKIWHLFGKDYDYRYGRTVTPIDESSSRRAIVGGFRPVNGLYVGWFTVDGDPHVWVPRLVVPKRNHV